MRITAKRKCACGVRNVVGDQLVLSRNRRDTHSYEACLMFSRGKMCVRPTMQIVPVGANGK